MYICHVSHATGSKNASGVAFFYGKQRLAEEIIACCVVFRKQPNLAKFAVTHFQ